MPALSHRRANRPTLWQVLKQTSMQRTEFDNLSRKAIIRSVYQSTVRGDLKECTFEFKDGQTGSGVRQGSPKDLFKIKKKKPSPAAPHVTLHVCTRVAKRRN
jgi:hypothetical protein